MKAYRPIAFVIMPFAEEFLAGYQDVIAPAVERAGLDCIRADQEGLGNIHTAIYERIFDAPVVVADISDANPNVHYELGVAHCTGRKTITVVREDWVDRIPFDLEPYRVVIYPRAPEDTASRGLRSDYEERKAAAIDKLAAELAGVTAEHSEGIANPVQDFLAARSPLTCRESQHLSRLDSETEDELLRATRQELVCLALTGSDFMTRLAAYLESGERRTPLSTRLLLLDPDDREGWGFVYHLREGRPVSEPEVVAFLEEDRKMQERAQRLMARLERVPLFSGEIVYYTGIPLFWAYLVDSERLVVGHLAMDRTGSRNLPVSVLIRDDPRTRILYDYYHSAVQALADA